MCLCPLEYIKSKIEQFRKWNLRRHISIRVIEYEKGVSSLTDIVFYISDKHDTTNHIDDAIRGIYFNKPGSPKTIIEEYPFFKVDWFLSPIPQIPLDILRVYYDMLFIYGKKYIFEYDKTNQYLIHIKNRKTKDKLGIFDWSNKDITLYNYNKKLFDKIQEIEKIKQKEWYEKIETKIIAWGMLCFTALGAIVALLALIKTYSS
jgi:hypothetical protein